MAASTIRVGVIALERAVLVDYHDDALDITDSWHIQADQVGVRSTARFRRSILREGEMGCGLGDVPMASGILLCKAQDAAGGKHFVAAFGKTSQTSKEAVDRP